MMCANSSKTVTEDADQNSASDAVQTDLHYIVRQQKDSTEKAPVLMLLHGYGSNEQDLFSISSRVPDNWLVVSVRAPLTQGNGYKWYDVKFVDEKITMNFEHEENSRKALLNLMEQLEANFNIDKYRIVTAGFSQGSNMSLALALTEPEKIMAAGCFSGRFMPEIKPIITNEKALKAKKVFLSHGTEDKMLPMTYAEETLALLTDWEMDVRFSPDKVAHSISKNQMDQFIKWLEEL